MMNHADVLKLLFPLPLTGEFDTDIALEGAQLDTVQESAKAVLNEIFPDSSYQFLKDWERICGLSPAEGATLASRRDAVISKLRAHGGLSRSFFIALAAYYGITITIDEMLPFMCGWNRAGDSVYIPDTRFIWRVNATGAGRSLYPFRAGTSFSGERLLWWKSTVLESLFNLLKPAHTFVTYNYTVSGSVNLSNFKLSAIDDLAFVDFNTSGILTNYIGGKITIYDSAGHSIVGYIQAAGTGETLGSNIISNSTFESGYSPWTSGNNALLSSVADGYSGNCLKIAENGVASPYAYFGGGANSMPLLGLYKWVQAYVKSGTATQYRLYSVANAPDGMYGWGTATGSWSAVTAWDAQNSSFSKYFTKNYGSNAAGLVILLNEAAGSAKYMYFDEIVLKQVLSPSSAGVTIVNAPSGLTNRWLFRSTAFNFYDPAGYTYKITY